MGFFKKIFSKEKEEDQEENAGRSVVAKAPMYENQLICNACNQLIQNTPRFFNLHGKKMIFHKSCFKKLRKGNIQL